MEHTNHYGSRSQRSYWSQAGPCRTGVITLFFGIGQSISPALGGYLGAKVKIIKPGHSRVSLTINNHMTNFHGTTHGGIIFAISDMAFAAACNSHGKIAVALNVSICFLKATYPGDHLVAEAKEEHSCRRTSLYDIKIYNEKTNELVAESQDQAYRKDEWFVPDKLS